MRRESLMQDMTEILEWPAEGEARVPYRVFSDPQIYRAELQRIFLGPTWQFLALEHELAQPGDYLTNFLGETPVIVTRGQDGQIHAMSSRRCPRQGRRLPTAGCR
jgi:anthranilate 1,2-dioxygenase large subunit